MAERTSDFEWRGDGEGAEVVLYAPDETAFETALDAARLPGAESPVYAAASPEGFGSVAASVSHAAPDLVSAPERGLLLVADRLVEDLGVPPGDLERLLSRNLSGLSLPRLETSGVRRVCEVGALAAAEDGLIEEEDLRFLPPAEGDPDALGQRALEAGKRDWETPEGFRARTVVEVLDAEGAESLDLRPGSLVLVARVGAGDLGRISAAGHRERILNRVQAGRFDAEWDLPAAPRDTAEAADLIAAHRAAANFADARAALLVYALRRALGEMIGELAPRAAWVVGGFEKRDGALLHRRNLVAVREGEVLVSGDAVASGTGGMMDSAPPFGAPEQDGGWSWEEAGLVGRWSGLIPPEDA